MKSQPSGLETLVYSILSSSQVSYFTVPRWFLVWGGLPLSGCCDTGNGQPGRQHLSHAEFAMCILHFASRGGPVQPHVRAVLGSGLFSAAQIKMVSICLLWTGIILISYRHPKSTRVKATYGRWQWREIHCSSSQNVWCTREQENHFCMKGDDISVTR